MFPMPKSKSKNASKSSIRKKILNIREVLELKEIRARSQKIFRNFKKNIYPYLPPFHTIALYSPIRGEVDTRMFFSFLKSQKKICAYPKVKGEFLLFYRIQYHKDLHPGKFGILEPKNSSRYTSRQRSCPQVLPEVIFVPGIAFDHAGYRIGYGKGFYDRTQMVAGAFTARTFIGSKRDRKEWKSDKIFRGCLYIGLAYEFQILKTLPHYRQDQKLHLVVSEKTILKLK